MIGSLLLLAYIALAARIILLVTMVRWRRWQAFPFLALFLVASIARTSVLLCYANDWRGYSKILNGTENAMNLLLIAATIECWVLLWRHERWAAALAGFGAMLMTISALGLMVVATKPEWHSTIQIVIAVMLAGFIGVAAWRFLYWFEIGRALRAYAHGLTLLFAGSAVAYSLIAMKAVIVGNYLLPTSILVACLVWMAGMRRR